MDVSSTRDGYSFSREEPRQPEGASFGPIDDGIVMVAYKRPEAQCSIRNVVAGMSEQRISGQRRAIIVDRLLNTVRGAHAISGDIRPNLENIRFGKASKSVAAHPGKLDERS
jgi:hypothetical protein